MSTVIKYIKKQLTEKESTSDKNMSQMPKVKKKALKDIPNIEQFFSSEVYDLTTDVNEEMRCFVKSQNSIISFFVGKETALAGSTALISAIGNSTLRISYPNHPLAKLDWHCCIKQLIEHGADPNAIAFPDVPLLMSEITTFLKFGDPHIIALLLELGANCFARDKSNYTIMDWIIASDAMNKKVQAEDYQQFFSIDSSLLEPQNGSWNELDIIYQKVTISRPILRHWVKTLYKHYMELTAALNNEFSKLNSLPKSITNIISLYETSYLLMDISLFLQENPKIFDEFQQRLCLMLKIAYLYHGPFDSDVYDQRSVHKFIPLIFSEKKSSAETDKDLQEIKIGNAEIQEVESESINLSL